MKASEAFETAKGVSALVGALLLVGGIGVNVYGWVKRNDTDMVALEELKQRQAESDANVAATLARLAKNDRRRSQKDEELELQKLAEQIDWEQKCSRPNTELPADFCDQKLAQKRFREERERRLEALRREADE